MRDSLNIENCKKIYVRLTGSSQTAKHSFLHRGTIKCYAI